MYELIMTPNAKLDLNLLVVNIQEQITKKLKWLSENCGQYVHKPLKYAFEGQFSLRCGNYRVIYTLDEEKKTIKILRIRHRSVVYEQN